MPMTLDYALKEAMSLANQKRFGSALEALRILQEDTSSALGRIVIQFNRGVLYSAQVGDGEAARECFIGVVEQHSNDPQLAQSEDARRLCANSCENMMLLSLSYDEYENWARQLEALEPGSDILRGQRPGVRKEREAGRPWADILQGSTASYYNRNDPSRDAGRYGCAASIWQLVLKHRKELRLSRDDWGIAVFEYYALAERIAADAGITIDKSGQPINVDDFAFIVEATVPFIDEYLAANPHDAVVQKAKAAADTFVKTVREEAPASPTIATATQPPSPEPDYSPAAAYPEPDFEEFMSSTAGDNVVRHICQKCNRVLGQVSSTGGQGGLAARINMMSSHDMGICPHCGGRVVAVGNGDSSGARFSAPDAFMLHQRSGSATVMIMFLWVLVSVIGCLVSAEPPKGALSKSEQAALGKLMLSFGGRMGLAGACVGGLLAMMTSGLTVNNIRRDKISRSHGRQSAGMAVSSGQTILLSIAASMVFWSIAAHRLVPPGLVLRSLRGRLTLGAILGLILGMLAANTLNRFSRFAR